MSTPPDDPNGRFGSGGAQPSDDRYPAPNHWPQSGQSPVPFGGRPQSGQYPKQAAAPWGQQPVRKSKKTAYR